MPTNKEDELGALWLNKMTDGTPYFKGKLKDGTPIVIWKNKHKQPGEKTPDYRIYKDNQNARQG